MFMPIYFPDVSMFGKSHSKLELRSGSCFVSYYKLNDMQLQVHVYLLKFIPSYSYTMGACPAQFCSGVQLLLVL